MGNASRRKWMRRLEAALSASSQHTLPPWYESNLLWFGLTTFIAIILTLVPAMKHDLRWLLWIAWIFASIPLWMINNQVTQQSWKILRIPSFVLSISLVGYGLYALNGLLEPSPVEHAQLHITRRGPIVTKQGFPARLDVYYANRGEIDAIEVATATTMKFVELGNTVDSARRTEESVIDELKNNLSSPNMIKGTVPPGAEFHFTIQGPILDANDFSVPPQSTETEIAREGKLLLTVALIRYRDRYNKERTVEMCVYLDKPAPRVMNCLGGHNTETSQ